MAWYNIPKVKVSYVYNDDGEKRGAVFSASDFEQLVEKLEDFYDFKAVAVVKKRKELFSPIEDVARRLGLGK